MYSSRYASKDIKFSTIEFYIWLPQVHVHVVPSFSMLHTEKHASLQVTTMGVKIFKFGQPAAIPLLVISVCECRILVNVHDHTVIQAYTIYSLYKLVRVNYFRIKNLWKTKFFNTENFVNYGRCLPCIWLYYIF